jgi:MtN3 and saliva related transmembrane protein
VSAEEVVGIVAASYGIVMGLAPGLQILRILRLRSSRDVSIGYLVLITIGFVVWTVYAAVIRRPAVLIPNLVAFVVGVATILVALRFRSGRDAEPPAAEQ